MKKNETKLNNKGFSLVELIVVIAIMAVLVGVLAPQFIKYVERSRQSLDVQNIDQVVTALKIYYADEETPTDHTVTLSHTAAPNPADDALADAGIQDAKLKSAKWTHGGTGGVAGTAEGVTIKLNANGTVEIDGEASYFKADGTRVTTPTT